MPWVIPDSADGYLSLIEAIDRSMFGVHLDPVNLINCPARYYHNAALLRECFSKLGPWIVSCHGKDILMRDQLTVHLDEVRPGLGALDYKIFLQELSRLPGDVPLILEQPCTRRISPGTRVRRGGGGGDRIVVSYAKKGGVT